jgi:signal transduction histidine kinase
MNTAAKLIRDQKNLLPPNAPVPNRRILVVDDEPEIAAAIARILDQQNKPQSVVPISSRQVQPATEVKKAKAIEFEIVTVNTPEEAIETMTHAMRENRPFAMGFFDVMLGADIDGIQLVKQLLSVDPNMFAVFVTAYQDRSVDTIGSFLGDENKEKWDYINKPFTEGEILQKARNSTSLWDLHRLKEWQEERLSEAHQLLLQNERQNAAAAIGRSVAHEFGNLLTHIIGNAELALEQKDPAVMRNSMEIVLKAADTASVILAKFRNLQGTPTTPPVKKVVSIWSAIDEAIELLDFQFRKRYIHVVKTSPRSVEVLAHRHSLVQVFVNLFLNSMHSMANGGEIILHVHIFQGNLQISIRDTGPGIPEEILDRVTEPLFTTKGSEGSGLGLAICKELIEIEHDGQLQIQNHIKGGTEILLTIPLGEKP